MYSCDLVPLVVMSVPGLGSVEVGAYRCQTHVLSLMLLGKCLEIDMIVGSVFQNLINLIKYYIILPV